MREDANGESRNRYTILEVGTPPQSLEVDIDMLSPDYYTIVTASGRGVKYDAAASKSHGEQ
jgi:hypothetical protein